jgi:hypothetical protein
VRFSLTGLRPSAVRCTHGNAVICSGGLDVRHNFVKIGIRTTKYRFMALLFDLRSYFSASQDLVFIVVDVSDVARTMRFSDELKEVEKILPTGVAIILSQFSFEMAPENSSQSLFQADIHKNN